MINWERVADLRAEIGPEDFEEVVSMFLEEADSVVARMAQGSVGQLAHDLHFLKGSALNLGFRDLAQLCQEAERRIAFGQPADLVALIGVYHASLRDFATRCGLAA